MICPERQKRGSDNCTQSFHRKMQCSRLRDRTRIGWEDNIKTELTKTEYERVERTESIQDRAQWMSFVKRTGFEKRILFHQMFYNQIL